MAENVSAEKQNEVVITDLNLFLGNEPDEFEGDLETALHVCTQMCFLSTLKIESWIFHKEQDALGRIHGLYSLRALLCAAVRGFMSVAEIAKIASSCVIVFDTRRFPTPNTPGTNVRSVSAAVSANRHLARSISLHSLGDTHTRFTTDALIQSMRTAEASILLDGGGSHPDYIATYSELKARAETALDFEAAIGTRAFRSATRKFGDLISRYGTPSDKATWAFWCDWYQGFLDGKPLDWELQRRVALIEDESWEAGPEAVAEEIERIRAKFDLEKRVEELEAERDSLFAKQSRHGIGGNNPPETMQIEPQIVKETTIIWAAVDDLKSELPKEKPDKSIIRRAIDMLGQGLKAILAWCGRKGDLTVDQIIKWGVPLGGAAILANPKRVTEVIEAAEAWIATL